MHDAMRLAYRLTRYDVGGMTFRVGKRSAGIDRLLASNGHRAATFVTAFNPFSRRMPAGWNCRMQARLALASRGSRPLEGTGCWHGWCEAHYLLFGDPRPVIRLARRFRQNAVVVVRLRQAARLVWVGRCRAIPIGSVPQPAPGAQRTRSTPPAAPGSRVGPVACKRTERRERRSSRGRHRRQNPSG